MKKFAVTVAEDFNENKGGYKFDKEFDTYTEAYKYVQSKSGIMGSPQYKFPEYINEYDRWFVASYNGRDIIIYKGDEKLDAKLKEVIKNKEDALNGCSDWNVMMREFNKAGKLAHEILKNYER